MAYRKNYKTQRHLSISDLNNLIKDLEDKQEDYPKVVTRVAERVAEEMQKEVLSGKYKSLYSGNPYADTQKEVISEGNKATAKIVNHDPKALFYEMGTGVIGKDHPAVSEYVQRFGWVYDHHGYNDDGWWYPTTDNDPNPYKWTDKDGQLRAWTKGLRALNGFYYASRTAMKNIKDITLEELKK